MVPVTRPPLGVEDSPAIFPVCLLLPVHCSSPWLAFLGSWEIVKILGEGKEKEGLLSGQIPKLCGLE